MTDIVARVRVGCPLCPHTFWVEGIYNPASGDYAFPSSIMYRAADACEHIKAGGDLSIAEHGSS
jgi:hypothetical protein